MEAVFPSLTQGELAQSVMAPAQLQGFILAVASAPQIIATQDWWPMLWLEQRIPASLNSELRDSFLQQVMQYYQQCVSQIRSAEGWQLPAACLDAQGQGTVYLRALAAGYVQGHQWLSDLWQSRVANLGDNANRLLNYTLFCSLALAGHPSAAKMLPNGTSMPSNTELQSEFPALVTRLAELGRKIAASEMAAQLS